MKSEIVLFMKRKFVVFLHIQHNRPQQVIDTTADNKQPGMCSLMSKTKLCFEFE